MSNNELSVEQKVQICINLINSGASVSTARYAAKRYGVKLQFNQKMRQKQKVANKQATVSLCLAKGNSQEWLDLKESHNKKSKEEKKQYRRSSLLFSKYISKKLSLHFLKCEDLEGLRDYIVINNIKTNCFVGNVLDKLKKVENYGFIQAILLTKKAIRKAEITNLKAVNKAAANMVKVNYKIPSIADLRIKKAMVQAEKQISAWNEIENNELTAKQKRLKSNFFAKLESFANMIQNNAWESLVAATGEARQVVLNMAKLLNDCGIISAWSLI
jgi:hypothetical protein